jgi:hypothetical protein
MLEIHTTVNATRQGSSRVATDIMIRVSNREFADVTNLPPAVFANQHVATAGTEKQRFVRIWFVIPEI